MNNTKYWIWLSLAAGPGSSLPVRLMNRIGKDIKAIYEASSKEYCSVRSSKRQLNELCDKSLDEAERIIEWCKGKKVGILCYDDPEYPERLRSIPDPPIVLYYIGELYNLDSLLCIAGVGTRRMTRYGHDLAYSFCHDLSRAGAVIVSGLAAGIDTVCHRAALDAGGRTVAVIGCRINKVYPEENRDIMREIARKGLLLTEYHPFFKTQPSNFAKRNRIISGLCQGTVIYEADSASGSLITADYARKQGRRVFSLPGKVGDKGALGTNELIRDGATPITRSADILEEFTSLYDLDVSIRSLYDYSPVTVNNDSYMVLKKVRGNRPSSAESKAEQKPEVIFDRSSQERRTEVNITDPCEKEIYDRLSTDKATGLDELVIPGYDAASILTALTMLELSGYITAHPGNTYTKIN